MEITYRTPTEADREKLFEIYAGTRSNEVAVFGWPIEKQEAFLRMQYHQREAAYKIQFPSATADLILANGEIIGSLTQERRADLHSLIDIALLPAKRGNGYGSAVLRDLQAAATADGVSIRLHVDKINVDALGFYIANGFGITDESQINYRLEWSPPK